MGGENYISQLTDEEQADVALQRRAREIIEAREPELGLDGCERLRWYMGVIDGMLDRKWIYFPTEQSRDEGARRAKRAAMEYSLWSQLYPDGNPFQQGAVAYVITTHNGVRCGTQVVDDGVILIYKTRADAQRVADILKREGV